MDNTKYRCPRCGNTDLVFAKETTTRRLFKMLSNGTPSNDAFDTIERYSDESNEYLECPHCNLCCDFSDGAELSDWENQ